MLLRNFLICSPISERVLHGRLTAILQSELWMRRVRISACYVPATLKGVFGRGGEANCWHCHRRLPLPLDSICKRSLFRSTSDLLKPNNFQTTDVAPLSLLLVPLGQQRALRLESSRSPVRSRLNTFLCCRCAAAKWVPAENTFPAAHVPGRCLGYSPVYSGV